MSEAEMMMEWEEELAIEGKTRDGFSVTDDGGAEWCLRKMREADEEYDRMNAWYLEQIEKAKSKRDATKARMTAYLQDYAETIPMRETKTQRSYNLPHGKLIWKKATTKLEHDDAVLLETLKKAGKTEYVNEIVIEHVAWAKLKKDLMETGEAMDGVTVVEVPATFEVKVEG